jgi:hypothetical protein
MSRILTVATIWLALWASSAAASSTAYKCTIKNALTTSQGKAVQHGLAETMVGKEFFVDRTNGRIRGDVFSSAGWTTTQVLDNGSSQQSFKALYLSSPYVHVRVLVVQEFDEGKSKSFALLDDGDFISGTCVGLS